jgi:hypothetical protein
MASKRLCVCVLMFLVSVDHTVYYAAVDAEEFIDEFYSLFFFRFIIISFEMEMKLTLIGLQQNSQLRTFPAVG